MSSAPCPACQRENPDDAAFCNGCGARLAAICPACSRPNPPDSSFCNGCGGKIAAAPSTVTSRPAAPRSNPSSSLTTAPPVQSASAAVTPAAPTTFADGRYVVERLIGEGGKKRVYLARDESLGRAVALAIIKSGGFDDPGQVRVRHEAQAMGRLGDHPNIVTVYDIGEDDGQLYIVSEYMGGGDVESRLRNTDGGRLPIDEALRIASEVCLGLEHAHANGVVHRDLKPGNVWLKPDGSAAIGDFGLAISDDRSRITQEGMMVGTVAYMPPEQAMGRSPDAKSDLYALGATLYEMLAGRPPFAGDDAVSIISQHINTPPVAPSWHNPEVAKPLDALVLSLLAKVPDQRPASARDVGEALQVLASASTVSAAPEGKAQNPLDRLASGIFVGRERELEDLRSGIDAALSGRGQILLLVGEPGIGKTRTSEEISTYAKLRGASVLWGRCYEGEGAPTYWPWLQVVRGYAQECDSATLLNEMGAGAAAIADVVSEVRQRLPGLQPAAQLGPEESRFRLFDAITNFLKNASRVQPLLIVLDDLHWADKPSLLLLQFLVRELAGSRILLLGTYRDVELGRRHPLAETLADLSSSEVCRRVLLRGLAEPDVGRFLELSAGHPAAHSLVAAVHRETEGNPFFVNEVVRLLAAEGRLDGLSDSGTWSVAIPQGIREAVGRRLNQLSDACNEVLTIGSVIGREFDLVLLERVADVGGDRVVEALDEAEAARVIQEMPETPGRYRFSHALVRETLYEELNTTRRVRLHRRIGETIESLYGDRAEGRIAELAYHFGEGAHAGGDVAKAVEYAARAGRRATALMAHEDAIPHYERALQLLDLVASAEPRERCDLLLALAYAEKFGGEAEKSLVAMNQALEVARRIGDPRRTALVAAAYSDVKYALQIGEADSEVVAVLEKALRGLGDESCIERVQLLVQLAQQHWIGAGHERGGEYARQAIEVARKVDHTPTLLEALLMRSRTLWARTDADEVMPIMDEALALAEQEGRPDDAVEALTARFFHLFEQGELEACRKTQEQIAGLVAGTQNARAQYYLHLWDATWTILDGRLDAAERLAQTAFTFGQRCWPDISLQMFGVQMATLRFFQGRTEELVGIFEAAVAQHPQPAWLCALAWAQATLGRHAEARATVERLAPNGFAALPRDGNWQSAIALLSDVCSFVGATEWTEQFLEWMKPFADRNITSGAAATSRGSGHRYAAHLHQSAGRIDEAVADYERALEHDLAMGIRIYLPLARVELAEALLERGHSGDTERALRLLNEALDGAREMTMPAIVERALSTKLRVQGIDASETQRSIYSVARSVQERRPDFGAHVADDGTVTLMFSDMQGFTAMTERLGDRESHRVVSEHNRIVREQIAAHRGHEVDNQGDGFLVAFRTPGQGLDAAVGIQRAFADYNAGAASEPIRVRIGLHTGEAIIDADKFFGRTVIMACRIADQAGATEILVSGETKSAVEPSGEFAFVGERSLALKGFSGMHLVHSVAWS